jgi:hypothetical protein
MMALDPIAVELIELAKHIEVQLLFPCSELGPLEKTDGGRLEARMALGRQWMGEWLPKFQAAIESCRIARPEIQALRGAIADTIVQSNSYLARVPAARLKLEEMAILPSSGLDPLTDEQQKAFDYIKANQPVAGKAICKALAISSESTFTRHFVPALRKHGVKNKRGAGYYVD